MDNKITELEEKFSHLDHSVEELNDVIFRQTQKIDKLEAMIKHLSTQLEQLNDEQKGDTQVIDDRPPHY
ncbi:SlyX family protein [Candidatus Thioglobus sp.]|uniref:SlyX family protein n=1 Tax=Candidatus Thioglobus sp. TaxID=2026721 RepID=UPI0032421350